MAGSEPEMSVDYVVQRRSAALGYGSAEKTSRSAVGVSTERDECARVSVPHPHVKCGVEPTDTDHDAIRRATDAMTLSLQEALDRARAGDPRGVEEIYARLAGSITRFAHSRNADDPEGLTNDVFLAAFRHLDDFAGDEDDLRGWIFTIARNKLIDDARRRGRRPQVVDDPVAELTGDSVESDVVGGDWVDEQLAILTDEQREVLLLRVVGGLTVPEIADVTDRTIGSVKALQRRALRQLQKHLDGVPVSNGRSTALNEARCPTT
jgi:RNA polymerase sigma-70 factor, ECF subfamily